MDNKYIFEEIKKVSLSMFRKNFFGVYHGSISARDSISSFIVNKKEAIFDEIEDDSLITLYLEARDYRWNIASMDAPIHEHIYLNIPEAKYICYTMPPYAISYTLSNDTFAPVDFFGDLIVGKIDIYDPGDFSTWYNRAAEEIADFFKANSTNMMLIKGFGLVCYDRDIIEMAKKIALLENSARLIALGR